MLRSKVGGSAGGSSSGNPDQFDEEFDMPDFPGWENKAPGKDYEWKGKTDVDGNVGNWYNKLTGESLHWDINHKEPIGPHWDYSRRDVDREYRIFPDNSWQVKICEMEEDTLWKAILIG